MLQTALRRIPLGLALLSLTVVASGGGQEQVRSVDGARLPQQGGLPAVQARMTVLENSVEDQAAALAEESAARADAAQLRWDP